VAESENIELAREREFRLGQLTVRPSHRELVHDDGTREVIEHRIMQVLIALARSNGSIVTRDELGQYCWDGRIVGDDAINRVISRLRKLEHGIGQGSFRVETLTKVGYRLLRENEAARQPVVVSGSTYISRRAAIVGASTICLAGAGALVYRKFGPQQQAPDVVALKQRAVFAMGQGNAEGNMQAISLYRRVTDLAPDDADAWGLLGIAYAFARNYASRETGADLRNKEIAVATRSLELDPANAYGVVAKVLTLPYRGHWLDGQRAFEQALEARPSDDFLLSFLAVTLCAVGRFEEAWTYLSRIKTNPPSPWQYYRQIQTLWGTKRAEELDRVINAATELYPTNFSIWFSRFFIALYGGRPTTAILMGEDSEHRPSGIVQEEIDNVLALAYAARSRRPADIAPVVANQFQRAHEGTGKAENAIQVACLFNELDMAFEIADAYYFERGFTVPDIRFNVSQGTYLTLENRMTQFLFQPSTSAMRKDSRFAQLTEELELDKYWRDAGASPDYRLA